MRDLVYCCGFENIGKRYDLPSIKLWRRLYFLDECPICGQTVASLQECSLDGTIRILKRVTGKKAIKLKEELTKKILYNPVKVGSLVDERTFYNNRGIIYNFNNRKIGINEDFCSKELLVINK